MRIAAALLISLCAAPLLRAQKPAEPKADASTASTPLGEKACATIANSYATAETWSLQAMAMLSLGADWHPVASPCLLSALASKDVKLQVYALEQLRRTNDRVIGAVTTKEMIDEVVDKLVGSKNAFVRNRAVEVLERVLPGIDASKPSTIAKWWAQQRETYATKPWTPADGSAKEGGTAAGGIMEKAFDLRDAGLQVVFVVDSTGSMQLAIDAVRDAISEIAAILGGIAPKLELGLVHYKDFGDMGDPAEALAPLTKNVKVVREKLAKLRAGGGDEPERVEHGVQVALDKSMGWDKEKNRMLLVVGDAPPHPDVHDGLIGLVRGAYEKPFQDPKRPVTGKQEKLKPFITSTIATSPRANPWFEQIAEAGGGTMVLLDMGGPRPGGPPAAASAAKPVSKEEAPERIAKHVLRLSFGPQFAAQIAVFVDTFFDYRRAGAF